MTTIYALIDPNGTIRYIGKTSRSPQVRLKEHLAEAKSPIRHVHFWIKKSLGDGVVPSLIVLEIVSGDGCLEEIKWISKAKADGCDLCNHTDGGEGIPGRKLTGQQIQKQSDRQKGKSVPHLQTPEVVAKRAIAIKKAYAEMDAEAKAAKNAKISESNSGKHSPQTAERNRQREWTPEMREKIAAKLRGEKLKEETKQKMAAIWTPDRRREKSKQMTGRKMSQETKDKIAAKMRLRRGSV